MCFRMYATVVRLRDGFMCLYFLYNVDPGMMPLERQDFLPFLYNIRRYYGFSLTSIRHLYIHVGHTILVSLYLVLGF